MLGVRDIWNLVYQYNGDGITNELMEQLYYDKSDDGKVRKELDHSEAGMLYPYGSHGPQTTWTGTAHTYWLKVRRTRFGH